MSCAHDAIVRKTVVPTEWPKVFIVSLKRWTQKWNAGQVQWRKVHTTIDFETVLSVHQDAPPYHLRGVVEHQGAVAGVGHYVSYVRAPNNCWYFCDDGRSPQQVSTERVLRAQAYVLVYET